MESRNPNNTRHDRDDHICPVCLVVEEEFELSSLSDQSEKYFYQEGQAETAFHRIYEGVL
jgi:hypothetical protein